MTSRLLIGTWEGIVSFKPEGDAWKINKQALKNFGVFDLAISPDRPNRVFAGTRGDGVWVSEDLGDTWRLPSLSILVLQYASPIHGQREAAGVVSILIAAMALGLSLIARRLANKLSVMPRD